MHGVSECSEDDILLDSPQRGKTYAKSGGRWPGCHKGFPGRRIALRNLGSQDVCLGLKVHVDA